MPGPRTRRSGRRCRCPRRRSSGGGAASRAAAAPGAAAPADATPDFSGTNTHEVGVDEPDLVKTDGKRIVTVSGGVLRVVDAASWRLTGSLSLALPGEGGG